MKRIMISAMQSGSGKTVLTCALSEAFQRRGLTVESFKCGPDYIDPMFHERVLQVKGRNLDLFLQGQKGVKQTIGRQSAELAVLEGAMGFYDGIAGTEEASAYAVSSLLDVPVVLAVRPKGAGITLAAQIRGLLGFRENVLIKGIVFTDCSAGLCAYLKPIVERETGLTVFGFLPHMKEAEFDSRHLGLVKPDEIPDFRERIGHIAEELEKNCDLNALYETAGETPEAEVFSESDAKQCRIGVAKDEAFCFYYRESLEALEEAGAELIYFSPLHDCELPEIDGLYLGGGYPELYVEHLSENESMKAYIKGVLNQGLPCIAECGGFLYLQDTLQDKASGRKYEMTGYFGGEGFSTTRLQRFGYLKIRAEEDSMLFRKGSEIPAHEFHYWDTDDNGADLTAVKRDGRSWRFGYVSHCLYAGFPHLHLGSRDIVTGESLAERFVKACKG